MATACEYYGSHAGTVRHQETSYRGIRHRQGKKREQKLVGTRLDWKHSAEHAEHLARALFLKTGPLHHSPLSCRIPDCRTEHHRQ